MANSPPQIKFCRFHDASSMHCNLLCGPFEISGSKCTCYDFSIKHIDSFGGLDNKIENFNSNNETSAFTDFLKDCFTNDRDKYQCEIKSCLLNNNDYSVVHCEK